MPSSTEGTDPGQEFGWKAHQAIQDWTRNVDQKASITLALTTAVGAFAAREVLSKAGSLYALEGTRQWSVRVMGIFLLFAILSSLHAVFPSLKRKQAKEQADRGLIYFGHLRHRSIAAIQKALEGLTHADAREQLAYQLHVTSRIAWNKHARLQRAQVFLLVGLVAFGCAELLP